MIESLRWKVSNVLLKRAAAHINDQADFKEIKRGLRWFKLWATFVPKTSDVRRFGDRLRQLADEDMERG